MAYEKLVRLAGLIYEKTKAGQLRWEATSKESTFQVSFPKYSVLIQSQTDEYKVVTLRICNEEGQVIEELTQHEAAQSSFDQMHELFENARRIAMGVEETLDELLKVLERPNPR